MILLKAGSGSAYPGTHPSSKKSGKIQVYMTKQYTWNATSSDLQKLDQEGFGLQFKIAYQFTPH